MSIEDYMKTIIIPTHISTPINFIMPRWLTMVLGSGDCQICNTPEGNTHSYYLNIRHDGDDKSGFLVCGKQKCNKAIKTYLHNLYSTIYNNKIWKRLLNIYANHLFITVERTNGTFEYDWQLDNDWEHDNEKIPLYTSFICAILCNTIDSNSNNNSDTCIYSILPNEIWEYIYNICLEFYRHNINVKFTFNSNSCLEPCIRVKKGDLYKKIPIEFF